MVLSQLMEGLYEDAEGQIELLSVMHSQDDLSPEFRYLQAMLAKYRLKGSGGLGSPHLQALDECREFFFRRASSLPPFLFPFRDLVHLSPDFLMRLAVDYLLYLDSPARHRCLCAWLAAACRGPVRAIRMRREPLTSLTAAAATTLTTPAAAAAVAVAATVGLEPTRPLLSRSAWSCWSRCCASRQE
jgi:hypothetical protein